MFLWHMGLLDEQPNMRVVLDWETYRVGDMDREDRIAYCWREAERDVNRAIHSYNLNIDIDKARTSEAL